MRVGRFIVLIPLLIIPIVNLCQTEYGKGQNTNVYISKIRSNIFVSSIEDLKIILGVTGKIISTTISTQNVQSKFIEDEEGNVWFSTYEALHVYIPEKGDFEYQQVVSRRGDTIRSDYKVIGLDGVDLYFKAGDEFYLYDVCLRQVIKSWSVPIRESHDAVIQEDADGIKLYYSIEDTLYWKNLDLAGDQIHLMALENRVGYILNNKNSILYLGMNDGRLLYWDTHLNKQIHEVKISNKSIVGMCWWGNELIILSDGDQMIYYDVVKAEIVNKHFMYGKEQPDKPLGNLLLPYVDPDSILWIGSDGYGVVSKSLKPLKFKTIDRGIEAFNVAGIFEYQSDKIISVSRNAEIGIFSTQTASWISYTKSKDPVIYSSFVKASLALPNDQVLMADWDYLLLYDLRTKKYTKLKSKLKDGLHGFLVLKYGPEQKIYALASNKGLVELILEGDKYIWKPVNGIVKGSKPPTYFDVDAKGNVFLGNNDESILFYNYQGGGNYTLKHEFPIPGGVKDVVESKVDGHMYLANDHGLYDLDLNKYSYVPVQDKTKSLHQVIYCVMPDTAGYLWMSSNSGILRYSLQDSSLHNFKEKDGIQNFEYNSFAYLRSGSGNYFMGGISGINYFDPYAVKLSTKKAVVDIYSFKINDEETKKYGAPNALHKLTLPYEENTVSFEFLAIDYEDPQATQVKYKMEEVDDDFILASDVKGFARYPNLKPGTYRFKIMGSNADRVWNPDVREVELEIIPPFWMTWWFRFGMIFSILGISFLLVRFYYQRQIEKRDQVLREQKLIIDKQEAIERERNRIASEMHDDLGSGLTTIRYLSDRALKNVSNEEEQTHIKKIADQSNSLVRNMSEIIWAMNSRFDTVANLTAYIRRYASEYLEEYRIKLTWHQEMEEVDVRISGEKRRNVFLVIKEALHNVVKHASAKHVHISVTAHTDKVEIIIQDDGIGFNTDLVNDHGNGLHNMQKRMNQIGGDCRFLKEEKGTGIVFTFYPDQGIS